MPVQYGGPNLSEFFQSNEIDNVVLIEPGGNHGDDLIYRGMHKLLDEIGISYKSINVYGRFQTAHSNAVIRGYRRLQRGTNSLGSRIGIVPFEKLSIPNTDMIVVHGGGNFNDFWVHGVYLLHHLVKISGDTPITVAPQTYFFNKPVSEALPSQGRVHLFCREPYSFSLLNRENNITNFSTYMSKDTAFYLEEEDLHESVNLDLRPQEEYILSSFRTDKESILMHDIKDEIRSRYDNIVSVDTSKKANFSFSEFVSYAKFANSIHTDRLHVAILGSILGKKVTMYENIYYKNTGVYEFSLVDDPNVEFARIPNLIEVSGR